jgi:hypothetical protein
MKASKFSRRNSFTIVPPPQLADFRSLIKSRTPWTAASTASAVRAAARKSGLTARDPQSSPPNQNKERASFASTRSEAERGAGMEQRAAKICLMEHGLRQVGFPQIRPT